MRRVETLLRRWHRGNHRFWNHPAVLAAFLAFVWIEFRWWPAVLLTLLIAVDQAFVYRRRNKSAA
jgi:hypothetical protein